MACYDKQRTMIVKQGTSNLLFAFWMFICEQIRIEKEYV